MFLNLPTSKHETEAVEESASFQDLEITRKKSQARVPPAVTRRTRARTSGVDRSEVRHAHMYYYGLEPSTPEMRPWARYLSGCRIDWYHRYISTLPWHIRDE